MVVIEENFPDDEKAAVAAAIAAGLPTDTVLGEEDDVTVEDGKEGGEDGESEDDPDLPPKNSYSEENYWDERYGNWAQEPFDWLFQWRHVEHILERYIQKSDLILCPGCGNAPLHPDMYDAGYVNQICLDTSSVVIEQMRDLHQSARPKMQWHAVDCKDTEIEGKPFDAIIDKSLIDTLRCCDESIRECGEFVAEMYRLLKPDGIYITFSLHEYDDEDLEMYYGSPDFDWKVLQIRLWNPHYSKKQDNSQEHSLIFCVMKGNPLYNTIEEDLQQFTQENDTTLLANCLKAINEAYREGSITEEVRGNLKDQIVNLPMLLTAEESKESLQCVCRQVMKILESERTPQ